MNQSKLKRLLRELTPDIWAYLFPSMPEKDLIENERTLDFRNCPK